MNRRARKTRSEAHRRLATMAVTLAIAMVAGACTGGSETLASAYTAFADIPPEGWASGKPCTFVPELPDSLGKYDVYVALRHSSAMKYREATFAVDLVPDSAATERIGVGFELADDGGNWSSPGFGALYQAHKLVKSDVNASSMEQIEVWQTTCDEPLAGITEIGIVVEQRR